MYVARNVFTHHWYAVCFVAEWWQLLNLTGSSVFLHGLLADAVCKPGIFRPNLLMLIREQWKPGLLFACLFIYFKLMIFVCDNSRQFIEEAHTVEELQDQKLEV